MGVLKALKKLEKRKKFFLLPHWKFENDFRRIKSQEILFISLQRRKIALI